MSTSAPSHALPNPTPLLFALALLFVAGLWFVDPGPLQMIFLFIAVLPILFVVGAWFGTRTYLLTVGLIAAGALPRLFLEVGTLRARPEHFAAGVAVLALPWLWDRKEKKIDWIRADWLIVAYLGVNFVSSLFMSPDTGATLKAAFQQSLAIAPYFFLRIILTSEESFQRAFRVALVVGALEALYAVIATYSSMLLGTTFAVDSDVYAGLVPAVYGTQFEPNIFGSFCGACAVMMLLMYLARRQRWYLIGYTISFAGMAVSFSRAALLSSLLALFVVTVLALRRRWMDRRAFLHIAGATVLVIALVGPVLIPGYAERFSTVEVSDPTADPTTVARGIQLMMGLDQFVDKPILGNGTDSFQSQFDWASIGFNDEAFGWLGNTEIRVLHDTGLVGFALFAGLLVSLIAAGRRVLKREPHPELLALMLSLLVYAVSFQFTEGTLLAFWWVHLGLIGCAVVIYRRDPGKRAEPVQS